MLVLGIDVGSTTVKAVVLDPSTLEILWSDYQRHQTKQPEKVLEMLEVIEAAIQLGAYVFAVLGPLDQHGQVLAPAPQRLGERDILFETAAPLEQPLRECLVLPEVGLRRARLHLSQFLGRTCCLKDAPASRTTAWRVPGTGERVLRVREPLTPPEDSRSCGGASV